MTSETVQKLDPFREEAARRGIPSADVERWLSILRPCASLGPDVDGPVVGKWGGNPMLPADVPHPPFTFVASIDCAALPREATDLPMPSDGHLLLFADPELSLTGRPAGTVVYVPAGTAVAERAWDYDPDDDDDTLPVESLRLRVDPSLPNRAGSALELPRGKELSTVWWNTAHRIADSSLLQVGGYPWVWNNDPVQVAKESLEDEDWVLLAMADGSYDLNAGERDLVSWVIRRGDLAARHFDRVYVYTDGF